MIRGSHSQHGPFFRYSVLGVCVARLCIIDPVQTMPDVVSTIFFFVLLPCLQAGLIRDGWAGLHWARWGSAVISIFSYPPVGFGRADLGWVGLGSAALVCADQDCFCCIGVGRAGPGWVGQGGSGTHRARTVHFFI